MKLGTGAIANFKFKKYPQFDFLIFKKCVIIKKDLKVLRFNRNIFLPVIPAKAGISFVVIVDSRLRGNDRRKWK